MNKVTLSIEGMMCGMCEAHICDELRKICPPKAKISASHTAGTAEIILDESPDVARMKAAIKATGYQVLGVNVEPCEEKKRKGFSFFSRR